MKRRGDGEKLRKDWIRKEQKKKINRVERGKGNSKINKKTQNRTLWRVLMRRQFLPRETEPPQCDAF